MALEDSNMFMPVAPANYGGGLGGDWGSWIILFLIFGMFGGGGFGGYGGGYDFPWLLQGQNAINTNTNAGFDNLALQNQLAGINNSINSGFATTEVANCNRAMDAMQTAYNNQIADLNRSFDAQTANTAALSGISSQLSQCCCDNRLATVQTQNIVQSEGAATRLAIQNQTQAILDRMCQQEIDALKTANANLQTQVLMKDLAASQTAQTTQLIADNTAQTQYIVNRVAPYPIPSYTVPNPFTPAA